MSNQLDSKSELSRWDSILDEYEGKVGLPAYKTEKDVSEVQKYLDMSRDNLEKMSGNDCGYAAYLLTQYALYLQRSCNRETARINWVKSTIKNMLADAVTGFKGYSYEERLAQAIKNDDAAQKLEKIRIYAQQRVDRIGYLSSTINNLSNILLSIQRGKNGRTNIG